MLQAWIASPRESLYFAAEARPCNLAANPGPVETMLNLTMTYAGDWVEDVLGD
jgi:hypothetical protein